MTANKISVTGVSLNKTNASLIVGGSTKLTATVSPSNATNKGVVWSSNNTSVVTVDANGNVKGVKAGTATITVKTSDGGKTASCKVTVTAKKSGTKVKNGWINEGGFKYYKNGVAYTGWHWMTAEEGEKTPHWSYFGKDGKIYTGWRQMGKVEGETVEHWSYFGPNGWLRTGWHEMGTAANPDGKNPVHWSYFGDNGWLRLGWQQIGKGTSNPDGNNAKHWSYFGLNGWLRLGLQEMGTASNPDGNNPRHKSYFGNNGWLVTNRTFSVLGKTYRADSRGWI